MKKIKEDIPSQETLQTKLHTIMESGLTDFVKTTNARRLSVRAHIRFVVVSVLFMLATFVFLYMAQIDFNTILGNAVLMIALLWATVLLISGRGWFVGSTLLAREINMALVPILANVFNRTMLYTYNESAGDSVAQLLDSSGLLVGQAKKLKLKNVYTVFSEADMRVREITLEQSEGGENAKSVQCHATFIDANLPAEHTAATIISTPGSRHGFSHAAYSDHVQAQEGFEATKETDQVATFSTDKQVSGEFLTKELLQVVQNWQEATKVNLRVVRTGTKLYILIPAGKESMSYTSVSTKQEAIERYAGVIARPIWQALLLAEEAK